MNGQPVWLASISRVRPNGKTLYVPEWSDGQLRQARKLLRFVTHGVGNDTRQRLFRMNITLCLHKAATEDEVKAQGPSFWSAPGIGLAGGPVEVLEETEPGALSTKPCESPRKKFFESGNPHAWLPIDCGQCPPCLAREAV